MSLVSTSYCKYFILANFGAALTSAKSAEAALEVDIHTAKITEGVGTTVCIQHRETRASRRLELFCSSSPLSNFMLTVADL